MRSVHLRMESLERRDLLATYSVTNLGDFHATAMNQSGQIVGTGVS